VSTKSASSPLVRGSARFLLRIAAIVAGRVSARNGERPSRA